jgi:hypothetical protein
MIFSRRKKVIEQLRAEGWHLVKTPEWVERQDPMRFVRSLQLRTEVDGRELVILEEVTDQQLAQGPSDMLIRIRQRMIYGFSGSLLRRLAG